MLESQPVASLLDRLADGSPTPGGGAAAALTAAAAAALLGMVTRVVSRRSPPAIAASGPAPPAEEADDLRRRALALMDADAAAYRVVVAARRAASGDAGFDRALVAATEPPLEVARLGRAIIDRCAALGPSASGAVRSDLAVAATLARAALDAASITVRANASDLRDRPTAERIERELARVMVAAEPARAPEPERR